jgi:hypothetical protein
METNEIMRNQIFEIVMNQMRNNEGKNYIITFQKIRNPAKSEVSVCTGGAARTPDTWFWRPVLYQLSYTRLFY